MKYIVSEDLIKRITNSYLDKIPMQTWDNEIYYDDRVETGGLFLVEDGVLYISDFLIDEISVLLNMKDRGFIMMIIAEWFVNKANSQIFSVEEWE